MEFLNEQEKSGAEKFGFLEMDHIRSNHFHTTDSEPIAIEHIQVVSQSL